MVFDIDSQQMKCMYCGHEQPIDNAYTVPVEHELDFQDEEDMALTDWGTEQQLMKCENCGAQMIYEEHQTAAMCAFCGSPKVLPQGSPNSIRPESVIPFHITREKAIEAFFKWKRRRWFVPNAFKKRKIDSRLTGIYVPFWTFDAHTASYYTAERGVYHYRTETRTRTVNGKTETYTVQVRYTVWSWTCGNYEQFFNDVLIPASAQHETKLLEKVDHFNLGELLPYKPDYLSGFVAERYTVPIKDGWQRAKEEMYACLETNIRRQIGGDEIRNLDISVNYHDRTYKHILLPVWTAIYSYKKKTYRYMVNGETGTVSGHVPRSAAKITCFIVFWLGVAAFLAYYKELYRYFIE